MRFYRTPLQTYRVSSILRGATTLLLSLLFFTGTVSASEVRQMSYLYYTGQGLSEILRPQFVICDNCPPKDTLKVAKNPLAELGIKFSGVENKVAKNESSVVKDKSDQSSGQQPSGREKEVKIWGETIYFSFDSSGLSKAEIKHLEDIVHQRPDSVSVNGYTCDIGSKSYNLELSKRRAFTVATYLKDKGIEVTEVIGKGECCPVSKDRKLNRRVELTLKKEVSQ
ncbi:MAG: OmpA family protein [Candidatus Aenigmatarchaeota archaeon]